MLHYLLGQFIYCPISFFKGVNYILATNFSFQLSNMSNPLLNLTRSTVQVEDLANNVTKKKNLKEEWNGFRQRNRIEI